MPKTIPISSRPGGKAYFRAQMLELASLGIWQERAAELLGITSVGITSWKKKFGITFPRKGPGRSTKRQRIIREGYLARKTARQILHDLEAQGISSSVNSIKTIASRIKVNAPRDVCDAWTYKRPFSIPLELRPQYRELRKLGLTIEECGYNLGLLSREESSLTTNS